MTPANQKTAPISPFVLSNFLSCFLITILCIAWLILTSFSTKCRIIIVSLLFSLVEFTFYGMTIELPNGDTVFKPFDPKCRKPHTVN